MRGRDDSDARISCQFPLARLLFECDPSLQLIHRLPSASPADLLRLKRQMSGSVSIHVGTPSGRSIHVRPRSGGKAFELRIKHSLLEKPFYGTFETEAEARRVGERGEAELDRGSR